jgi:hypothetical protein
MAFAGQDRLADLRPARGPGARTAEATPPARRLRLPANTLSRRIDQLEGQLGTRLLHRSTRGTSAISVRRRFTISAALKNSLARSAGEDGDQRRECSEHEVEHPALNS